MGHIIKLGSKAQIGLKVPCRTLARPPGDSCLAPRDESRNPRDNNYSGSSIGGYWTVERPINAPSKSASYLTIGSVVIIVWQFVNRGGALVTVKVGIRRVSHSLFIEYHLFPLLAPINSSFWNSTSPFHFSFSKLPFCHAYLSVCSSFSPERPTFLEPKVSFLCLSSYSFYFI